MTGIEHIETFADVESKIQDLVNEIFQRTQPVAYFGQCPVYVSDAVPKGKILVIPKADNKCWRLNA